MGKILLSNCKRQKCVSPGFELPCGPSFETHKTVLSQCHCFLCHGIVSDLFELFQIVRDYKPKKLRRYLLGESALIAIVRENILRFKKAINEDCSR